MMLRTRLVAPKEFLSSEQIRPSEQWSGIFPFLSDLLITYPAVDIASSQKKCAVPAVWANNERPRPRPSPRSALRNYSYWPIETRVGQLEQLFRLAWTKKIMILAFWQELKFYRTNFFRLNMRIFKHFDVFCKSWLLRWLCQTWL